MRRSLRTKSTILRVSSSVGGVQNAQDEFLTPHWFRAQPQNGFSRFADVRPTRYETRSRDFRLTNTSPNPPAGTCATPHDGLRGLDPVSAGLSLLGAPRTPHGNPTAAPQQPHAPSTAGRAPCCPPPTHGLRTRREHAQTRAPIMLDCPAALQPAVNPRGSLHAAPAVCVLKNTIFPEKLASTCAPVCY